MVVVSTGRSLTGTAMIWTPESGCPEVSATCPVISPPTGSLALMLVTASPLTVTAPALKRFVAFGQITGA